MKKLELYTGGHPFKLDAFDHLQGGIAEMLDGLAKGLMKPTTLAFGYKLYGCAVTLSNSDNTATVTAGYILLLNSDSKYEVCAVDAQVVNKGSGETFAWQIDTASFADAPQNYSDGNTHNTLPLRKAVIYGEAGLGVYDATMKYFIDAVVGGAWVSKGYSSADFYGQSSEVWTVAEVNQTVKYQIVNKTVHLTVYIGTNSIAGPATAVKVKLPAAITPKNFVYGAAKVDAVVGEAYILASTLELILSRADGATLNGSLGFIATTLTYEID